MLATTPVRLLLIEDDERTLDIFCDALRTAGYEVDGVPTATAALDALAQRRYNIVIADNILPDIRGVDLLAAMRGAMPTTPLILYSGNVTESVREQAKDFGVYAVLEKPIALERLVGVVGKGQGRCEWRPGSGLGAFQPDGEPWSRRPRGDLGRFTPCLSLSRQRCRGRADEHARCAPGHRQGRHRSGSSDPGRSPRGIRCSGGRSHPSRAPAHGAA